MQNTILSIPENFDLNTAERPSDNTINQHQANLVSPEDLRLPLELLQLLPPLVTNYLDYASPLSDAPDEFLLTPFLAITGSLIGNNRFVELGGITVYPVIWTVIFAGSSTLRKSTSVSIAKKPFKGVLKKWKEEHEINMMNWQEEKESAEDQKQLFDVPPPAKRTLYCSDGFSDLTFWEDLKNNGSLTSTPTEFTALWNELTRPRNSLKDLALSIFDAEDSIRRNTKNAGDIELQNPIWCIVGATTLSNFQKSLTAMERSSGLLQRILPICMKERTKPFKALTELVKPDEKLYNEICTQVEALSALPRRPVSLTLEAAELYTNWSHQQQEKAYELEQHIPDIGGYVSRLDVYTIKFALIFQTLDNPNYAINGKNMKAAILLCQWLFKHIIFMLQKNYIFNRTYSDRLKIRELLTKQGGKMSRTDLMNYSNFDKEQLDKAIDNEVEAGFIERLVIDTGGRPRYEYKLKPESNLVT